MKPGVDKILEAYNNLNDQARYALLVGVVFLVILLDVVFLVLPQMNSISSVHDQIKKLSEDTQEALSDSGRINPLRKKLHNVHSQYDSLSSKVRNSQEVPAILATISSIANEFGVTIDQLVPEKSQQEVLNTTSDGKYYGLPVIIKARCGYHKFGRFLNKLENQDLYLIMKDFIIQNDGNDPKTHLFSLTVKIILVDHSPVPSKKL